MRIIKIVYVRILRLLRAGASSVGLLSALERRRRRKVMLWLRSLFAIYDIDDMIALDIPWWSLDAMQKVDNFLRSKEEPRVFEYGSGASTVWLARRARSVVTIEHDAAWAEIVQKNLSGFDNARLRIIPAETVAGDSDDSFQSGKEGWDNLSFERYTNAIRDEGGTFDLIVIDGRARSACMAVAMEYLKPDGMIVFDNSGRKRYRASIERSRLKADECRGLTACLPYVDPTTLLTRY